MSFGCAFPAGQPIQSRVSAGSRRGKILVTIDRGDYWQCAYIIRKGGFETIRKNGLPSFREDVASVAPFLKDRIDKLEDWDQIKLLTVAVDCLRQWSRPGLLCIGDSAHAMSPAGGVGINLAIQDAVAAANILAEPLKRGPVDEERLRPVQKRREFPVRMTQKFQVFAHHLVLRPALSDKSHRLTLPLAFKLLIISRAGRIPARMIGLGFRPEHVRTPDVKSQS
jgi:2-polyprenyl-6-methoxyphenol hydroxylase-like FAD-dependent oxidoreductase